MCTQLYLGDFNCLDSDNKSPYCLSLSLSLTFFSHQIDYQTFLTLSEEDLKEVGVYTFGARRKMLMAISGKNLAELPGLFIDRYSVGSL